jgi:hypothetical protein
LTDGERVKVAKKILWRKSGSIIRRWRSSLRMRENTRPYGARREDIKGQNEVESISRKLESTQLPMS